MDKEKPELHMFFIVLSLGTFVTSVIFYTISMIDNNTITSSMGLFFMKATMSLLIIGFILFLIQKLFKLLQKP